MQSEFQNPQQKEFESLIREMDDMASDISNYVNFLVGRQSVFSQFISSSKASNN